MVQSYMADPKKDCTKGEAIPAWIVAATVGLLAMHMLPLSALD